MGNSRYLSMLEEMLQLNFPVKAKVAQGWIINFPVVLAICTDFKDALFETMVKSS